MSDSERDNLAERARVWRRQGLSVQRAAALAREGFIADEGHTLDAMQKLLEQRNEEYYQHKRHGWVG